MYCSISCSRAARSPCSWYRRSSSLSLSPTGRHTSDRDLLREAHPIVVDVHVVEGRVEYAAQGQHVVLLAFDLLEHGAPERAHVRHELAVVHGHPDRDLAVVKHEAVEDRVERDLEVREILDREAEAGREPAEDEESDAVESGIA